MKIFFTFTFLFITIQLHAQDKLSKIRETPLYRAYYVYSHTKSSENGMLSTSEKMALLLNSTYSMYFSYDKLLEHIAMEDQVKQQIAQGIDHVKVNPGKVITPDEFLIDYRDQNVLVNTYVGRHFYYLKTIPLPDWTISTDQKNILGLNCYKASIQYLGRSWTVWFTPEVAMPAGPWLLSGLPGLIVSASDETGDVKFELETLEENIVSNPVLEKMPEYKTIQLTNKERSTRISNEEEILKLKGIARKDVTAFQIAQIHAMHELGGTLDYGVSNINSWIIEILNPIDLSNKAAN